MDAVLSDDRLNQSEIVYSFLSPSPDYLKKSANEKSSSKNLRDQKFHLSNFFKSTDLDHELPNRVTIKFCIHHLGVTYQKCFLKEDFCYAELCIA